MKNLKILTIFILLTGFLFLSCESNDSPIVQGTSNLKASSKVLVEFFTNTSCVYCPPPGHFLDAVDSLHGITINDTNVVIIKYHTDLFPNDPFHIYNAPDNLARENYYEAGFFNPLGFMMGAMMPSFSQQTWTNTLNQRLSQKNSFSISATNNYNASTRTGEISITVGQLSGSAVSDLKLHVAITESQLFYNAPNGETYHQNTLRDLITPGDGESISITPGTSQTYVMQYSVPTPLVDDNCGIVIFVQSHSSKEVLGTEKLRVK